MPEKLRRTPAFATIALKPVEARRLLDAVEQRAIAARLARAARLIAAREATIEVLRLDPPGSRTPRIRGALSALFRPSRAPDGLDPGETDRLAGSGLFLAGWYRDRHREAVAGGDPWAHYLAEGLAAGLAPNPFFDADWYVGRHLGGRCAEPAILHYLRVGARYALAPGPLFDSTAYLCADERIAGEADALAHFLTRGIDEGRTAIPVA